MHAFFCSRRPEWNSSKSIVLVFIPGLLIGGPICSFIQIFSKRITLMFALAISRFRDIIYRTNIKAQISSFLKMASKTNFDQESDTKIEITF